MNENPEIQMLHSLITGLQEKIAARETDEKQHLKAVGLSQGIETAAAEISELETHSMDHKEKIAEKQGLKTAAISETINKMCQTMDEVLPFGKSVLEFGDDVFIGWKKNKKTRPYHGLSGSEKIIFNQALSHAFQATILAYEAGDGVDAENVIDLLDTLDKINDKQIIVTSWFKPNKIPEGWTVLEIA